MICLADPPDTSELSPDPENSTSPKMTTAASIAKMEFNSSSLKPSILKASISRSKGMTLGFSAVFVPIILYFPSSKQNCFLSFRPFSIEWKMWKFWSSPKINYVWLLKVATKNGQSLNPMSTVVELAIVL